ncbi:TRPM4 [Mytilus edulis]|uniref:TRPM4 n=1 Tax=Mytilus edulis TaxID=6550 RepID=A0A8S3PVT9_MYTED|nr:TRPM4 [Mytilus edulis]
MSLRAETTYQESIPESKQKQPLINSNSVCCYFFPILKWDILKLDKTAERAINKVTQSDKAPTKYQQNKSTCLQSVPNWMRKLYYFYNAPLIKFLFSVLTYVTMLVVFSMFVLTDLHSMEEKFPSIYEYIVYAWAASSLTEEIRQAIVMGIFQNFEWRQLSLNAMTWFSFWTLFEMLMYVMFITSVFLRLTMPAGRFYHARMMYAIGPKVIMIGRMVRALPDDCTENIELYSNGTMDRCPERNQINTFVLAVYMVVTHIVLVNLLIAMFTHTFTKVQDNNELVWKFHRFSLIEEYYDRSSLVPPFIILSHLRIFILYIKNKCTGNKRKTSLVKITGKAAENEKLAILEKDAVYSHLNSSTRLRRRRAKDMDAERDGFEAMYEKDTELSLQEQIHVLSSDVDIMQKDLEETLKTVKQIMTTKQNVLIVEVPRGLHS